MYKDQKHSPKYWVVHDKTSDEVFINTASKNRQTQVDIFLDDNSFDYWGCYVEGDELLGLYELSENLETILVEINIVKV